MDPTKQGGAASSNPYYDLYARLLAMRLEDPSSSRQQAWYPAPTPLLPPSPQEELAPTATPAVRPLLRLPPFPPKEFVPTATYVKRPPPENPPQPRPQELVPTNSLDVRLLQQLHAGRQYRPQSQPQLLGYGGGESSAGAGCVSPVGTSSSSSIFASPYGKHSPRFNASAAPFLSKVPKPSNLSASAEEFHPIRQSNPSMAQSSSTRSSSGSQCLPQLGVAAASSARHDNASLDPYASTLLTAGHAYQDESQWRGRAPAIGSLAWLDEVRARLLYAQRKPASLMSARAAERVVHHLAERGEEVRLGVLDAVKLAVHRFMGCREWHVVFLALLHTCEGRFDELHGIVMAACTGGGSLMHVTKEVHGETALKELIRVVAPYTQLSQTIIVCLLRERVMEHGKGAQLLRHCFTTLPYKDYSMIIRLAIATSDEMVSSVTRSKCLEECFEYARNEELRALELFILSNTRTLAEGKHSNWFLQRVLECGSKHLQVGIAERVAHSVVVLCEHPNGSYVVEACIELTCSLVPLRRVLDAFQDLGDDELAKLVQGIPSNYVVQKLLRHFEEQTMALARRIVKLPLAPSKAIGVVRVAKKLLPKPKY